MAVNCCCVPGAIDGADGATEIDTSVGGVTVKIVEPLILPEVAEIVAAPVARALAKPWVPAILLTVATVLLLELQVTESVRL